MATLCEEFYCRRGDRAPEKDEFHKLPPVDKQLICQLRSAIDVARDKVSVLRDEVQDKDRDISREAALRKAAEARLEQMVDMYGDPAVTEELRQRLPRAGKDDPKIRLQHELEELTRKEASLSSMSYEGKRTRRNIASELEDQIVTGSGRKSRSQSADSIRRRRSRRESYDEGDDVMGRGRRHRSHSPPDRSHQSPYNNPYPTYPPTSHYPPFYPPMYAYHPPPLPQQMIYTTPPNMMQQDTSPGNPMAQSTPANIGQMHAGHYVPQQPITIIQAPPPQIPTPPTSQSLQANATQSILKSNVTERHESSATKTVSLGGASIDAGMADSKSESSMTSDIKTTAINREQQRQISKLLAELDASRELNKKLQEKLTTSERELETLRAFAQTREATEAAVQSGRIAELVEEIYRAQKIRDESMMGRLRIANEERDEALIKLKHLQKTFQRMDLEKGSLEGSLSQAADRLENLELEKLSEVGGSLVETILSKSKKRQEISTEEMRAVLQERDAIVAKCRQLQAEVVKLQRQNRVRGTDRQQSANVQAKLLATQQERDLALARVRKLEEELQTIRVYYSLHKSLSQEANLRDQFNNSLKNFEGAVKERDSTIEFANKENNKLLAQIKSLIAEKNALEDALDKSQGSQKELQANCEKLERLVNVLRRKINGLGTKLDD